MSVETVNPFSFTPLELAQYQRDGFLIRSAVFSADEIIQLQATAEAAVDKAVALSQKGKTYHLDGKRFVDINYLTVQFEHELDSKTVRVIEPVHELAAGFEQLIDDKRITDPMRSIIGQQDLALWTAKLNLKRQQKGSGFGWHQDSPYWVHDSEHVDLLPNVMVSFDQATKANGCLKVIRASHLKGCLPGTNDGSQLGGFFTDPNCFDEADAVHMEAPAGSLIFFSPHCIHGSTPNHSSEARRAMVITYQPDGFAALKSGVVRSIAP